MKWRYNEIAPEVKVAVAAGMKLRYIEIAPEIIAELPAWSQPEMQKESELTLKDLGISREPNESYLYAWARAMLSENGLDDNVENRKRLTDAAREHPDVLRFVWVIGGDERKAFGLEDSPALQRCLAERAAKQELVHALGRAADYGHPDYSGEAQASDRCFDRSRPIHNTKVLWPLLIMLAVLTGGWLAAADLFGRIILLIFMTGWVAAYFYPSFGRETWPEQLAAAFLGGLGGFWLVMSLTGTVVAWLMPWKWPWRLLVSLSFAALFAVSIARVWKRRRKHGNIGVGA